MTFNNNHEICDNAILVINKSCKKLTGIKKNYILAWSYMSDIKTLVIKGIKIIKAIKYDDWSNAFHP